MKKTCNQMVTVDGLKRNEPLPYMMLFNEHFHRQFFKKHLEPLNFKTLHLMILSMCYELRVDGKVHHNTLYRNYKYFWKGVDNRTMAFEDLVALGYLVVEGKYISLTETGVKLVLTYNAFVIELVDRKYSMFFRERNPKS